MFPCLNFLKYVYSAIETQKSMINNFHSDLSGVGKGTYIYIYKITKIYFRNNPSLIHNLRLCTYRISTYDTQVTLVSPNFTWNIFPSVNNNYTYSIIKTGLSFDSSFLCLFLKKYSLYIFIKICEVDKIYQKESLDTISFTKVFMLISVLKISLSLSLFSIVSSIAL